MSFLDLQSTKTLGMWAIDLDLKEAGSSRDSQVYTLVSKKPVLYAVHQCIGTP